MTALLYYFYSRSLTDDQMIEIDKAVFRNRELVYRFITKFPSNTKWKIKIAVITICLGVVLEFSNIKSVEAISSSLLLR